ncbi:hypothetical protein DFH07DRAFT_771056 [Mycena maculata]|uniref:Secreted protein n=1 Tax=Mycena maculata TaxID=230809 RepID=A0AAD7JHU7_9AGAR|nr:hypothetical protein DFH07DRAFT_771056 [Mycena maculata]
MARARIERVSRCTLIVLSLWSADVAAHHRAGPWPLFTQKIREVCFKFGICTIAALVRNRKEIPGEKKREVLSWLSPESNGSPAVFTIPTSMECRRGRHHRAVLATRKITKRPKRRRKKVIFSWLSPESNGSPAVLSRLAYGVQMWPPPPSRFMRLHSPRGGEHPQMEQNRSTSTGFPATPVDNITVHSSLFGNVEQEERRRMET